MGEAIEDFLADGEEVSCPKCGGGGYFSDCWDDMCHGNEECIHGDDSTCSACHGEGFIIDAPDPAPQPSPPPPPPPKET
jgi:hypothetical protein